MTVVQTEIVRAETRVEYTRIRTLTDKLRAEGERVRGLTVDNDEEEREAGARLAELKAADKLVKELIATGKRPFLDVTQTIDKLTKPDRDALAFAIGAYTSIIGDYNNRKLEARRQALAEAQAAARQRDSEAVTEALNARQDAAKQKLEGVSVRLKWIANIVDPEQVPRTWCIPDEKAINAHARACHENDTPAPIPGVEFQRVGA